MTMQTQINTTAGADGEGNGFQRKEDFS